MQKTIVIGSREVEYTLKINKRSKGIRLSIHPGGRVVVTTSKYVPQFLINKFLTSKRDWLKEKIDKMLKVPVVKTKNKKEQKEEYLKYKDDALKIVNERLQYYNQFYNFKWGKVTIRNQKTRWGSCSRKGNLNFNYKIAILNPLQADYIVVHELCHLKEFNHSKNFWALVHVSFPNYLEVRKSLKKNKIGLS